MSLRPEEEDTVKVVTAFVKVITNWPTQVNALAERIASFKHGERCNCDDCQLIDITIATLLAPQRLAAGRKRRGC